MRIGYPPGITAAAALALDFAGESDADRLVDLTGNNTASLTGSNERWHRGPFGPGLEILASDTYVEVPAHASTSISDNLVVEAWVRRQSDDASIDNIVNRTSSGTNAWRLFGTATTAEISWQVYNSGAAASQTLTTPLGGRFNRWLHVLGHFVASDHMAIYVDGQLAAYAATTLTEVNTSGLGPIRIGGGSSAGSNLIGRVAHVRVGTAAAIDVDQLSPNLDTRLRTSRRLVQQRRVDATIEAASKSWTTDSGAFYLADADLLLSRWIVDDLEPDVQSVKATSSKGGSVTTYTRKATVAEVQAGSDCWTRDRTNGRIYVSEDPATIASGGGSLLIVYRKRFAERGMVRAGRWTAPALLDPQPITRRAPMLLGQLRAGDGGGFALATQHPDVPDGLDSYDDTGVILVRAAVQAAAVSDGIPFSAERKLMTGFVESSPTKGPDRMTFALTSALARAYATRLSPRTVNVSDYPNAPEESVGYQFPEIWGGIHLDVEAVCTSSSATTTGGVDYYTYQVAARAITKIENVRRGDGTVLGIHDVDLDAGTFKVNGGWIDLYERLLVDVWGYGTPSSPTSPAYPGSGGWPAVTEWGDSADCDQGVDMVASQLSEWLGITSLDTGTTGSRVSLERRFAEALEGDGAAVSELERALHELLCTLYPQRATAELALRDLNKADATAYTLLRRDVISGSRAPAQHAEIAQRLIASAYAYRRMDDGTVVLGAPQELATAAKERHDQDRPWNPPRGEQTRISHVGSLLTWMQAIDEAVENPDARRPYNATVPPRIRADLWDEAVVDVPDGPPASTTHRVTQVTEHPDGRLDLQHSPDFWAPADGTSAAGERTGVKPARLARYRDDSGTSLGTGTSWTAVPGHLGIFQGHLWGPDDVTHHLVVYGSAVGGTLEIRLVDVETSNVIATVTGIGAEGFYPPTPVAFSNIPTVQSRVRFEWRAQGGASATTLFHAVWFAAENTPTVGSPVLPLPYFLDGDSASPTALPAKGRPGQLWVPHLRWGSAAGATVSSASYALLADDAVELSSAHFPTARVGHHFKVYAETGGGTMEVRLRDIDTGAIVFTATGISGSATWYEDTSASVEPADVDGNRLEIVAKITSGTGKVYIVHWLSDEDDPPKAAAVKPARLLDGTDTVDAPTPSLMVSEGSSTGISLTGTAGVRYVAPKFPAFWMYYPERTPEAYGLYFLRGYVNVGGATTVKLTLVLADSRGSPYLRLPHTVTVTATGFFELPILAARWRAEHLCWLEFEHDSSGAAPTLYQASVHWMAVDDRQSWFTAPGYQAFLRPAVSSLGGGSWRAGVYIDIGTATDLELATANLRYTGERTIHTVQHYFGLISADGHYDGVTVGGGWMPLPGSLVYRGGDGTTEIDAAVASWVPTEEETSG